MSMSVNSIAGSAVSSALRGINTATAAFNTDAQAIAAGGDVTGALVDMSQQSLLAQLNVRVLAMSEKTLGSLLDVSA